MNLKSKTTLFKTIVLMLTTVLLLAQIPIYPALAGNEIDIPDSNLNKAVRKALSKPYGPITTDDMSTITHLQHYGSNKTAVRNLSGLEFAINLEMLDIEGDIKNLAPLAGLSKLRSLRIKGNLYSRIADFSPLGSLVNLEELTLNSTYLKNLSFVEGMTNLRLLNIRWNYVRDITALAKLKELTELDAQENIITDLTPILNHPNLSTIKLQSNPLGFDQAENVENLKGRVDTLEIYPLQPVIKYGELKDFVQTKSGWQHTLALKKDGTVWGWGDNSGGVINGLYSRVGSIPIMVHGVNDVVQIATTTYSYAVKKDGTLWTWGNGTLPTKVEGISEVAQVAPDYGSWIVLVLKKDGTVWAYNKGALHSGGKPIQVSGLENIVNIAAAGWQFAMVKKDGTVWTLTPSINGVQVPNITGVKEVSCGWEHTLAVTHNGDVYAWGKNYMGQLGDGTTTDRTSPVKISGLSGIEKIAAGDFHSLALNKDGQVWSWGNNSKAQCAPENLYTTSVGALKFSYVPYPYLNPLVSNAFDISAGASHSVALVGGGSVSAWGYSFFGQLGVDNPEYSTDTSNGTSFEIFWDDSDGTTETYDVEYKEITVSGNESDGLVKALGFTQAQSSNWTKLKAKTAATSTIFKGQTGKNYLFRVRGWNANGSNNWNLSSKKTVIPYDNDSLIKSRKGFNGLQKSSKAFMGKARYSTKANDTITYKFKGKKASLIITKGSGMSKAKIYIDGVYKGTVDAKAESTKYRQVIFTKAWKQSGTHEIKIINLATKGRNRFEIDALAVVK